MPNQTQPPADEAELPGFRTPQSPGPDHHPDELSPTLPGPSTTSSPPTSASPSPPAGAPDDSSRSTTGSTDEDHPVKLSEELRDELENFSGGLFELAGLAVNKMMKARTHSNTRLWLVTEDEAEAFAAPAGRIAARRVPEELQEGDGADALIMGSVLLGYGMRNLTGVTDEELARREGAVPAESWPAEQAAPPPPPPPPAPPPTTAGAPATIAAVGAGRPPVVGVEEATPPPPFSADL